MMTQPQNKLVLNALNVDNISDKEFGQVRALIRKISGITMGDTKRQLIMRRLAMRLKALGMTSIPDYIAILESGDSNEVELFTNAITTNLTSFFRENHHFEFLRQKVLPDVIAEKERSSKRLRIWSAGCSTGEEPYSLAMTLNETMPNLGSWDARVLCTDIDTDVLATARAGAYPTERVDQIPAPLLKKWFKSESDRMIATPELKKCLSFRQLNLMQDWPMRGKFDVIFCRNVVIYFDKPTQRILMDRYANIIEEGGYLILGHSESLHNVSERFSLVGKTIYQKKPQ